MRLPIYYVRKIFRKTNISYPLICTRSCTYQWVRNISFSENFGYVWPHVNMDSSLWDWALRGIIRTTKGWLWTTKSFKLNLKSDSHLCFICKKLFYLLQWKPFKNDEKCFFFHLSSFRSQEEKTAWLERYGWLQNLWSHNLVNNFNTHTTLGNISREIFFFKTHTENKAKKLVPDLLFFKKSFKWGKSTWSAA